MGEREREKSRKWKESVLVEFGFQDNPEAGAPVNAEYQ